MTARTISVIALALFGSSTLACLGIGKDPEGTNAGECSDGADNDNDDLWDCEDDDCEGSPDCPECWEYDYDTFGDDMLLAACNKMRDCDFLSSYFTYEDCMALEDVEDTGEPWECEDYDCESAVACEAAWVASTCQQLQDGTGFEVCDDVCSNY